MVELGSLGNHRLWSSCGLNPQSLWIWQNGLIFFSKLPTQSSHTHMPSKPFGENSKVKKCWFPVTVTHLNYFQWPDPSCSSPNLINHSLWEWKCPLFIHTESNYEICSSKQPRVRESLGALTAQSIPSTVTWMTWRWKPMGLLCIGSFLKCWVVLTHWLKTGVGFHPGYHWEPEWWFSRLMKTVQWKPPRLSPGIQFENRTGSWFSHVGKGPVLMVKNKK